MASIKLCLLGFLVFAMLSAAGTWARKEPRSGEIILLVRETTTNNVDLPKLEKTIKELAGNSNDNNVMIREVTSDGGTTDNLKCKNSSEQCTAVEECCSGICVFNPIWPPRPGRCV